VLCLYVCIKLWACVHVHACARHAHTHTHTRVQITCEHTLTHAYFSHFSRARTLTHLQIFYATIGASANIGLVITTAPVLFLFSFIALAGHLAFLLGVGSLLGFSRRELLIASNANIGGVHVLYSASIFLGGHVTIAELLIASNANIGGARNLHNTSIFLVGHVTIAELLIASNATVI